MSKTSHARHFSKRQSATLNPGCSSGAFYKSPKQGDTIDTSQPLTIQWDTSLNCFSSQGVDIYLYAPYSSKSMIHAWGAVSYSSGSFQAPLVGSWWNSTSGPIQLQLGFVESGTPAFLSPVPPGPMFSSTFNATDFGLKNPTGGSGTSNSTTSSDASGGGIFQTIGNAWKSSGLPKGSIAAAVIVPLIAVAIAIFIYVKFQRAKEAEKRKRWSQAVDKRMSTISTEWKGLPPNAQSEAIRQSIAIMRNSRASVARMSQVYGDEGRPSSTYSVTGGGAAGIGARKVTGVGLRNPSMLSADMGQRKSAVSFAADTRFSRPSSDIPDVPKAIPRPSTERTRPSAETQRSRASRAFHTAISASYPDDVDALMSPTQKGGPVMVDDKDIKQLELGKDDSVRPALSSMHRISLTSGATLTFSLVIQHGQPPDDGDFLILAHSPIDPSSSLITAPPATHLTPISATSFTDSTPYSPSYANTQASSPPMQNNPFAGFTRGPSNMMSPDAMLRAYATRDGSNSPRSMHMAVSHPRPPSPSAQRQYYPALDAPAQPEPVSNMDLIPGPPPVAGGRTLYVPGQGVDNATSSVNRHSAAGNYEDPYGGYGMAA
ncbi:hypothetical protein JB92DRAFT_2836542 [Gautieria morchelliformis]|nr:hypothetical protein JB92DRAFT_2836542 [Gautieria morchelliformis]